MAPASSGSPDRSPDGDENVTATDRDAATADAATADGGTDVGFDEATLYAVVRRAVEDAILGALGTLLLVGMAFVIVWLGLRLALRSSSPVLLGSGVVAIALGFYLAATALRVVPPAREWL